MAKKISELTESTEVSGHDFVELSKDDGDGGWLPRRWAPQQDFARDPDTTTGLTWGYKAGKIRNDNAVTAVSAGTVGLTDDSTNYVEVAGDGTVSANTTGFTSGQVPLYEVVTVSGAIDSYTDKRAWIAMGGGGGVESLDDLSDVSIGSSPADDALLAYDSGTGEWIDQTKTEAGFGTAAEVDTGTADGEVPTNADLGSAANEDTGKTIGDVPQYEDDGDGNPIIDHPNTPRVNNVKLIKAVGEDSIEIEADNPHVKYKSINDSNAEPFRFIDSNGNTVLEFLIRSLDGAGDGQLIINDVSRPIDFLNNMPTVGGTPIIESGSNSDGYWAKWTDGTAMVWTDNYVADDYKDSERIDGDWTFPIELSSAHAGGGGPSSADGTLHKVIGPTNNPGYSSWGHRWSAYDGSFSSGGTVSAYLWVIGKS